MTSTIPLVACIQHGGASGIGWQWRPLAAHGMKLAVMDLTERSPFQALRRNSVRQDSRCGADVTRVDDCARAVAAALKT